jgi:hypothetical protein
MALRAADKRAADMRAVLCSDGSLFFLVAHVPKIRIVVHDTL